jgi:glycolate oxidase FAD binding subunit
VTLLQPRSALELSEAIASCSALELQGLGTKTDLGRSERPAQILELKHFAGITAYEPEELILEAGAATPLAEVMDLLAQHKQMLAFDPPDYSHLFGAAHGGSLGGLLACGFAGSRRLKSGSARDHVLGLSAVTGRGEIFKAGARVVKNVTGYDVPKLMAGSWGTLAAFTSIIFKVLPKPETEQTLFLPAQSVDQALRSMSVAMQSSAEVSCAAHIPSEGTYLRLEGIAISVEARRNSLMKLLAAKSEVLPQDTSIEIWKNIRDLQALKAGPDDVIWRFSVPPMDAAAVTNRVTELTDARMLFDWAGGLIWVAVSEASTLDLRTTITSGHAMLFRAPAALREQLDVFQPQQTALAALTSRVKAAMDPLGKLNPGRMYRGI